MTRIRFATDCQKTFGHITSRRLQDRLDELLDLIVEVPTIGSKLVRDSLKEEFGENCLKADLAPFLLIYEYDEGEDIVRVYGIVHRRSVT